MKKISILIISIIVGLSLLIGCQTQSNGTSTEKENESNVQSFENSESKSNQVLEGEVNILSQENLVEDDISSTQEARGGNLKSEYLTKYQFIYYGVDTFISDIVGRDKVEDWLEQFESLSNPNGRSIWEVNITNVVNDLNISKEEYLKHSSGLVYTEEQIEAIFSGDEKLINKAFVNEYALLVNDQIYTADWLATHTAKDFIDVGISEEVLLKYLEKINIPKLEEEYLAIKGTLKKENKYNKIQSNEANKELSKLMLLAPYQLEYYGLDSFFYEIVEHEKLNEWMEQFQLKYLYRERRSTSEANIINLVKELNISKEDFIAANQGLVYTDEQIEAIYSGDQKQINKAFVNEYALLVNGNIYTAEWLSTHSIQDYAKEGITKDILDKYLEKINISVLEKEYQEINNKAKTMEK